MKNNKLFVLFLSLFVLEILAQNAPPVQLSPDQVFPSSVDKNSPTNFIYAVTSAGAVSVSVFPLEPQPPSILQGNVSFCVGSVNEGTDLGCSNNGDIYDESVIVQPGSNPNLYIAVNTDSPSPIQFTISVSAVLDALSVDYQNVTGKYQFYGTVSSGIRRFYSYNPGSGDQQIQLEVCNSEDFSGNNNAVSANFLFNRLSDHWVDYNQTLADNPCGDSSVHGNVKVLDPSPDNNNSMFKICPSYVVTAGPLNNVYFSIDVLNFWSFPQLNGTVTYRISIDTTYNTFLPLTQTDDGYSYIYVAEFILEQSGNDAIVSFQPVGAVAGPPPTDMQYALFTDYSYSAQVKQYLVVNTSMASSCYLLSHESSMMVGSWLASSSLVAGTGSLVSFTATDFYKNYNQGTFHVNLVANSPSRGSFAYTFQTLNYSTSTGGLGGWAITFIVLGSIVGAVAILLVLGVIGYFAFMKYQNRSKYELL